MRFYISMYVMLISCMLTASEVEITKNVPYVEVYVNGKSVRITRPGNPDSYLQNTYALTSRPSPPFFIQPFLVAEGVETYGELEVLDFISGKKGIFIDARLPNWYKQSAIPGAVNMPFKIFLSPSEKRDEILISLGAKKKEKKWDFTKAKTLLLYCNGIWCGQSPTAIHALIKLGYPKEKLKYYRGGMQSWQLLGLTTIVPKDFE